MRNIPVRRVSTRWSKKEWSGFEENALAHFSRIASIGLESEVEMVSLGQKGSRPYFSPVIQASSATSDVRLELLTNHVVYNLVGISFREPLRAELFSPLGETLTAHQGIDDIDPRFPALRDVDRAYRTGRTAERIGLAIEHDLETAIALRYLHRLATDGARVPYAKTQARLDDKLRAFYREHAVEPVTKIWRAQEEAQRLNNGTPSPRPDQLY